jgi:hypothetical protein
MECEENLLLYSWIKLKSKEYEIENSNIRNFNFLEIIYSELFIFDFLYKHFELDHHLSVHEEKLYLIKNILKEEFQTYGYNCNNIVDKWNFKLFKKEEKLILWKLLFTLDFLYDYSVEMCKRNLEYIHNFSNKKKPQDESFNLYNIYHLYKNENNNISKNIRKNSFLFKYQISLVHSIIDQLFYVNEESSFGIFTFQQIELMLEEVNKKSTKIIDNNKTARLDLTYNDDHNKSISICPSPKRIENISILEEVEHNVSSNMSPSKHNKNSIPLLKLNGIILQHSLIKSNLTTPRICNVGVNNQTNSNNDVITINSNSTLATSTPQDKQLIEEFKYKIQLLEEENQNLNLTIQNFEKEREKQEKQLILYKNQLNRADTIELNNREQFEKLCIKLSEMQAEISLKDEEISKCQNILEKYQDLKILLAVSNKENIRLKETLSNRGSRKVSIVSGSECKLQRFQFQIQGSFNNNGKISNTQKQTKFLEDTIKNKTHIIETKNKEILEVNKVLLENKIKIKDHVIKIEELKEKINSLYSELSLKEIKCKKYKNNLKSQIIAYKDKEKSSQILFYILLALAVSYFLLIYYLIIK